MTWNYRIVKKQGTFGIHEVYYDTKDRPEMCSVEAIAPFGETRKELVDDIIRMLGAAMKPVLKYEKIGEEK